MVEKYDIAKEWSEGFCAALVPEGIDNRKSEHWHAGYSSGYSMRRAKNDKLNEYLVRIGQEPMGVVKIVDVD